MQYGTIFSLLLSFEIKEKDKTEESVNTNIMTEYIHCASASTTFAWRRAALLESWLSKIRSPSLSNHKKTETKRYVYRARKSQPNVFCSAACHRNLP